MALTAGAVGGFEPHAHMRLADLLGIGHAYAPAARSPAPDCRSRTARRARSWRRDRRRPPPRVTAPSINRPLARRAVSTSAPSVASRKARSGASAPLRSVTPAAMAWPPPLSSKPLGHRAPHRAADIDAGDGAARAGADAAGLERDGESGPAEFFLQPRRDEADDAGMPAFRGGDHHGAFLLDAERGHAPRLRPAPACPARSPGARG